MSTDTHHNAAGSLRIVQPKHSDEPQKIFCGHCGRSPDADKQDARVCPRCGMGVLLQAAVDIAPSSTDPFLVVDSSLRICAVSRGAERLLGVAETDIVNSNVGRLLISADAEAGEGETIGALIHSATRGETPSANLVVRPANTFGVRYWARVGPCGPPAAALLVLADAR